MKGEWFIKVYGPDGKLKDSRQGHNVVTTVGKEFIASFLNSAVAGPATFTARYLAIGTGVGAESASDTALGTEAARSTGTCSYLSGQIYQVSATFATGSGTGAITEYGLFSANAAGTMLTRDVESVITKGANDIMTVVHQLTFS